jgi:hypothetical protein
MNKINWPRVIAGGLLAGLIINLGEFILNTFVVKEQWAAAMAALGRPSEYGPAVMSVFIAWAFVAGITAIWLYAAFRPRFGPGLWTAVRAAVATWLLAYLLATVPPLAMEMMPARLLLIGLAAGLVEVTLGTVVGAMIYRED